MMNDGVISIPRHLKNLKTLTHLPISINQLSPTYSRHAVEAEKGLEW